MEPEFWMVRWQRGEIGFHQDDINPHLVKFWPDIAVAPSAPVFVPLCGKSRDMAWLHERGHTIWGVEISPLAVAHFFTEHGFEPRRRVVRDMRLYCADRYNIYQGDFFKLRPRHLPRISAVYDRASLVALPPPMRTRYVRHLARLLAQGARILLVSVDYPSHQMQGPPFAVDDAEVRGLFGARFEVRSLLARNVLDESPRFRERGLTRLEERVYLLTRV
jgi:thiopurine S-methyltransferase